MNLVPLGGPEALSPLEVVRIFEEVGGKKLQVEHVLEEALKAQYDAADHPVQKSFTGLMLGYTMGTVIAMEDVLREMPVQLQICAPVRRLDCLKVTGRPEVCGA